MLALTQAELGEVRELADTDTRPGDHATPSTRRTPARLDGRMALGWGQTGTGSDWDGVRLGRGQTGMGSDWDTGQTGMGSHWDGDRLGWGQTGMGGQHWD